MKKSVIAMIGGLLLGLITVFMVFSLFQSRSNTVSVNHDKNVVGSTQETMQGSELITEFLTEMEEISEMESESELQQGGILAGIGSFFEGLTAGSGTLSEKNESSESESSSKESAEKDSSNKEPAKQNGYPYFIRVNRQANCVTVYTKDADGNYTVPVKAMACSVGLTGNTPLGVSEITDKYVWRLLFGNVYGQYSVRFNGHILFHSVPYTSKTKDTLKEGQFNLLGEPASQGCVRLSCADAKWIYDNCAKGTKVEVYDSADPGPLGKPSVPKISENSPYKGWDPTDPDSANPWKKGSVTIFGVNSTITVNQGGTLDLLRGVSATDVDGLPLGVTVTGDVNVYVPGTYTVTYTATGVLGTQMSATAVVTVIGTTPPPSEEPGTQDTQKPETEEPSTEDTQKPETEEPGTEDTQKPETEEPGTEDTQKPETEEPGTEDTQKPETEEPGTEDTQEPETEESGIEDTQNSENQSVTV